MTLEAGEQETGGQVRDSDRRLVTVDSAAGVKYAAINATLDGDQQIVSAVVGKKIRVLGYAFYNATTAGLVIIKTGGTAIARLNFALNGSATYAGGRAAPAFETVAGDPLIVNNAAGVDTLGHIAYIEVS